MVMTGISISDLCKIIFVVQQYAVTLLLQKKYTAAHIALKLYFVVPLSFVLNIFKALAKCNFSEKQKKSKCVKSHGRAQVIFFKNHNKCRTTSLTVTRIIKLG